MLAFSVSFGGSMIWFGSSAGVGLSNLFPESRPVPGWIRGGWHVIAAYVLGFAAVMLVTGWHPTPKRPPQARPDVLQSALVITQSPGPVEVREKI
jgi:hypothetical protein